MCRLNGSVFLVFLVIYFSLYYVNGQSFLSYTSTISVGHISTILMYNVQMYNLLLRQTFKLSPIILQLLFAAANCHGENLVDKVMN